MEWSIGTVDSITPSLPSPNEKERLAKGQALRIAFLSSYGLNRLDSTTRNR